MCEPARVSFYDLLSVRPCLYCECFIAVFSFCVFFCRLMFGVFVDLVASLNQISDDDEDKRNGYMRCCRR